jgi:hypothetical protein
MDYILKYRGETVLPYDGSCVYNKKSYVEYEGMLFKSKVDLNLHHIPTSNPSCWEKIGWIGYGYKTTDDILIEEWKENKIYTQYDKVRYKNHIYMCKAGRLESSIAPPQSQWWEECGSYNDDSDKKSVTIKVNNDRTGDVKADNVVIYGSHTGDISANGEKSVVVVFGDVTGDITANQVIRLDNSDSEAVKAMFLEKQGQAQTYHDEL